MLFAEVNEHIRATETKHLQVGLGYLGVLGLAVSIIASVGNGGTDAKSGSGSAGPSGGFLVHPTWGELLAFGFLGIVGCISLSILDSYRGWKQHYKIVATWLLRAAEPQTLAAAPMWLTKHPYQPKNLKGRDIWGAMSPDNVLTYFIGVATMFAVAIFNVTLWRLVTNDDLRYALFSINVTGFAAFVLLIRFHRIRKRRRLHRVDIDDLGLYV